MSQCSAADFFQWNFVYSCVCFYELLNMTEGVNDFSMLMLSYAWVIRRSSLEYEHVMKEWSHCKVE